ncbi:hypothetical protein [Paraburkholderia sp. MM5477-R1]|uniref:hypothetical protein n=1 Tax=Paraburkholderia sp. MM5477-R1 TaxID=2991062 RepID=UPI003D21C097
MTRSIPEHWVERLFDRMSSIYGSRFLDLWRGIDIAGVKATWREGLASVSDAGLKRGVAALFHEKYPPTLPRFIELCSIDPMYVRHEQAAITHEHCLTPAGEDSLAKIRELLRPVATRARVPTGSTGIEWAFRILREADERVIPLHKLTFAQQAIANWCASHPVRRDQLDDFGRLLPTVTVPHSLVAGDLPPRVPSPHIYGEHGDREPGTDDEEVTA